MDNEQLISSIAAFGKSNIDKSKVIEMLVDVLNNLAQKKFGDKNIVDVIIDKKTGDLQIWRTRTVVADDAEEAKEHHTITLTEARKIEPDFEVGEPVAEEVNIDIFGRREVLEALKFLAKKRQDLEKERMYDQYKGLVGKVVATQVASTYPTVILYDDDKNALILPKSGQIPRERLKQGENIQAIVTEVERRNGHVRVILSRSSPAFLKELLTLEIPEILDEIVTIKHLARVAGMRSKVVVQSVDDRVDAAGACIGPGGRRIQSISRQYLNGERVDIIAYTDKLGLFVKRILGVTDPIEVKDDGSEVVIYNNHPHQMSFIRQNIFFVSKILDKPVKVVEGSSGMNTEEDVDDVYLDEFSNEIAPQLIEILKKEGFKTARQLLNAQKKEVKEKTGLDQDSIDNLYAILTAEFA